MWISREILQKASPLNSIYAKEYTLPLKIRSAGAHPGLTSLRLLIFLLLLTAALWLTPPAAAQSGSVRGLLDQSLILYRNGSWEQAGSLLMEALDKPASAPHLSRIYLMLSAVHDQLGDTEKSSYYARKLVRHFPESRYRDAAEFALARASYRDQEYVPALAHLLTIIDRNREPGLVETARMTGSRIVSQGLHESGLERYLGEFQRAGSRNWLLYWLARREYGLGHRSEGELWLQRLLMNGPEARLQRLAQELRTRPAAELVYALRIGVILPLSGYESANGMDFLRGVAMALQDQPQGVELVLKDSESSIQQGIRAMQELLDSHVDLVIGELAGDRSAAMAALASERRIPMLVPVSSDNGIAALGTGVYQMTSDLETRGAALARYAFNTLGLRTFVSLAPADDYGQAMSDAFANTIDKLGGTIIAQQWYFPGTQDVSRQFGAIRESASQFITPDAGAMAAEAVDSGQNEKAEYRYTRPTRRPAATPEDEEDIPQLRSIDGFFMPAYAEDISIIAPQFSLAHIKAVPLGGDDWLHGSALKSQRRYLDGAVFCAGAFADETGMEYIQFKNRFRMTTGTTAGPLAIAGYDLTHLITTAIQAGNRNAAGVIDWLSRTQKRSGIANGYSFAPGVRVNRDVMILQYKEGNISRLLY